MDRKNEKVLLGNISKVLTANFWVALVGFAGSFIFPKIMTIESYALYHNFILYVGYIAILHLGFPSGMVINYVGMNYEAIDKRQYKSEMSLLVLILTMFSLLFLAASFVTQNKLLFYITCAILPMNIVTSYKSLFQAWSRFKLYAVVSMLLTTMIPAVGLIYYLVTGVLPGDIYIVAYLSVHWCISIVALFGTYRDTRHVRAAKLLSRQNWLTEKTGLVLVIGNYLNTLFLSVDKQFVKWFFGTTEFAFYSFAMAMQSLMTVFIASIAQPLFPMMAQKEFREEDYNRIKKLLIMFGSLSGCAYFVTSFIVRNFIQKYIGSLEIVGIYFMVFPAMAVINCLYLNLYKIKNLMKVYIKTLAGILVLAVLLNVLWIRLTSHFTGVAIATTITYYVWFFIGFRQFRFLKLTINDALYLLLYIAGFVMITRITNEFAGGLLFLAYILVLVLLCYRTEFIEFVKKYRPRE